MSLIVESLTKGETYIPQDLMAGVCGLPLKSIHMKDSREIWLLKSVGLIPLLASRVSGHE